MYDQTAALNALTAYLPSDKDEQKARDFMLNFVEQHEKYWSRETLSGHLTASAWVTNASRSQAVLLHHKKLDIWVQPGGHIEADDDSLPEASLREALEETGLPGLRLVSDQIFDLDQHRIPARGDTPAHWHLDVRYWFEAEGDTLAITEESNDLQWLTADEIREKTDERSVLRMVEKTLD